jgi:hypothetical protein
VEPTERWRRTHWVSMVPKVQHPKFFLNDPSIRMLVNNLARPPLFRGYEGPPVSISIKCDKGFPVGTQTVSLNKSHYKVNGFQQRRVPKKRRVVRTAIPLSHHPVSQRDQIRK